MFTRRASRGGLVLLLGFIGITAGCRFVGSGERPTSPAVTSSRVIYAIAIHGGAGTIDRSASPAERQAYLDGLTRALTVGRDELARGGTALDAVEKTVRVLEDDEHFNAGKGAVFNERGAHELDASIMDGRTLGCGAVAGVATVKNPITLARLVMERSPHVLLMGRGAEQFADAMRVERVPNTYFDTPLRRQQLEKKLEQRRREATTPTSARATEKSRGTVGAVAVDVHGNLAAATSTGGMTAKRFGRVGDSPIIGAGTYADNKSVAVSCTGTGEEFIRHGVARDVAALIEYKHHTVDQAARTLIFEKLKPDDGGLIAVGRNGDIAMVFNTAGMYRGAADSSGRFKVLIFDEATPSTKATTQSH